jgi:hypothetical protein
MAAFLGATNGLLVGKQEGTPGTVETLAAADIIHRFYNVDIQPDFAMDQAAMKFANGTHAEGPAYSTTRLATLTFDADFIPATAGSNADAVEPGIFNVLNCCGFGNVASSTTGRIARRRAAYACQPWTFKYYMTELGQGSPVTSIITLAGCMGNVVFKGTMNQTLKASFSLKGKLVLAGTTDGTLIAATAASNTKAAQAFIDTTMTLHSNAEKISEWQLDAGNEVSPIWDSLDASGVLYYMVTDSKPRFSCNPLGQKFATKNWISSVLTAPTYSANQPLYGGLQIETPAAGRFSIKGMDAQPMDPKVAAREGFRSWGLNMALLSNGVSGALIDSAQTLEDTYYLLQGTIS